MMVAFCLILAALLLIGAAIDIHSRRLPNWLTASVALLYALYVLVSPVPLDWIGALAVAGASFVVGFTLFSFNLMGGGDVKLISGLALWAGADFIALFLLATGLAGGVMSVATLVSRRLADHPWANMVWLLLNVMVANRLGLSIPLRNASDRAAATSPDPMVASIPYGVAIAAGGFVTIFALLKP